MKYFMMACLMGLGIGTGFARDEDFTAKIFNAEGSVECLKAGAGAWVAVAAPYMLNAGDQIKTGPAGKADIYIKYGAKVRLGPETTFMVNKVSPGGNTVQVMRGRMSAWIRKLANRKFSVRTPAAVCAVRGTVFGVEVDEAGETTWDLFSGSIDVSDNMGNMIGMLPNNRLKVTPAGGAAIPEALPAGVKPPSEPAKIKEEKAEIKAEKKMAKAQAREEAAAREKAEEQGRRPVQVVEPVAIVIPTQEVLESLEVSGSNP